MCYIMICLYLFVIFISYMKTFTTISSYDLAAESFA